MVAGVRGQGVGYYHCYCLEKRRWPYIIPTVFEYSKTVDMSVE